MGPAGRVAGEDRRPPPGDGPPGPGDAMALRALDQMAPVPGGMGVQPVHHADINCFVFGGGLVNMGELLFGRVRQVFDSYCHTEEPVEFLFAQCGRKRAFGLPGAAVLNKKVRRRRGKVCQLLKSCGVWGCYVPVGRCPAADRAGRRDWRPTVFQPAQPVEKSSGPAARREADRPSREPFAQDRKRTSKGNAWMPFLFACGESRSEPLSPLWGACDFRSWSLSHRLRRPARSRDSVSRSASFLSRKLGKELPPPPARFFYYLHSLYTFAPWAGRVAASFPPRTPGPGGSTAPGRCKRPPAPAPPSRRRSPSPRQTG